MTDTFRLSRVHHVGVVVKSIERAMEGYRVLGLELDTLEDYPQFGLKIGFIQVGETLIELLEPTNDVGMNAEFLRDHGEGIHHIALETDSLENSLEHVLGTGMLAMHPTPVQGAGNTRIAFLNAEHFGGALLELVQPISDK